MSSILTRLQTDAESRLKADPYFADVAIILQRKGVTEKEIQRTLNVQVGRGGKVGACVLVLMPVADVVDHDTPGPRLALTQSFVVLTQPTLNAGSIGTGKDTEDIALRVLQLFHHSQLGYGQAIVGDANAIVPNDSFDGLVGYQVNLNTFGGPVAPSCVALPTISSATAVIPGVKEVSTIDVTGFDQSEYFTLTDANGPVYVWLSIDGYGEDPAPGGRGIHAGITLGENPTPEGIATDLVYTLNNDGAFTATRVGSVVTITDAAIGARADIAAGTSGCTVAVTTQGQASGPSTGWTVTLACATSGAAIYYTTDGSYPSSANTPAAQLYSAPFVQATAATIRAAAEKTGLQQSNVRQLILS